MGDGRAEELSAIEHEETAISLTPDLDGKCASIFKSSQLEGYYVEDLLYHNFCGSGIWSWLEGSLSRVSYKVVIKVRIRAVVSYMKVQY